MFSHNFDWLWGIFLRSPLVRKVKIEHTLSWNKWFRQHNENITLIEKRKLTIITNDIKPILNLYASQGKSGIDYFRETIVAWSFLGGDMMNHLAEEIGIIIAKVFEKGDIDIPYLLQFFEEIISSPFSEPQHQPQQDSPILPSSQPPQFPAKIIEDLMVHSLYLMKFEDVRLFYFRFFSKNYGNHSFPLIVYHMIQLIEKEETRREAETSATEKTAKDAPSPSPPVSPPPSIPPPSVPLPSSTPAKKSRRFIFKDEF